MDPLTETILTELREEMKEQRQTFTRMADTARDTAVALEHLRGQLQILGLQIRAHDGLELQIKKGLETSMNLEKRVIEVEKKTDKLWWLATLVGTVAGLVLAAFLKYLFGSVK